MTRLLRSTLIIAAAALSFAAAKPAGQVNWIAKVQALPSGAHRIGNPEAKIKVIEYVSYTCPHCAAFEKEASGELAIGLIRGGKGSIEYRPYMRNIIDIAASLLVGCGDASQFALNHSIVMRNQEKWMANYQDSQPKRWAAIPDFAGRMRAVASDLRLYDQFEPRGYRRGDLDRCLADEAQSKKFALENQTAESIGAVNGTPSFLINDVPQDAHDWVSLRPALAALTR
jgi:protein-disulfide isomerase